MLDTYSSPALAPGASATVTALGLRYLGNRRAEDLLRVSLRVANDSDTTNNDALVHVVFRYCDLAVRSAGTSGLVPSEGSRSFAVSLRNAGTTTCQVKLGSRAAYTLDGGKSTADRIPGSAPTKTRPGAQVRVALRASATGDVDPANNAATVAATVVGVGDSDVSRWGARAFSGRASGGRGAKLKAASLRLARVEIAVLRRGRSAAAGSPRRAAASARASPPQTGPAGRPAGCGRAGPDAGDSRSSGG